MNEATLILGGLALLLFLAAWRRGDGSHWRGVVQGWYTLRRTLPLLLIAFVIVGYVNVLAPPGLVQAWMGPQSGWRGLLLAEGIGMILPGGPYVVFPLIAVLYQAGAGLGPVITLIVSWAMLSLLSASFELSFMGWRFMLVRWGISLPFPVLVGSLVRILLGPL